MKSDINKIRFEDFRVSESHFKINDSFDSEASENIPLDLSIETQLGINEANFLIVSINIEIFKNSKEKNYPFEVYSKIQGKFDTDGIFVNLGDSTQEKLFIEKGLQELYPHMRSYILNLTSASGFPPLVLPPINYSNLTEKEDWLFIIIDWGKHINYVYLFFVFL